MQAQREASNRVAMIHEARRQLEQLQREIAELEFPQHNAQQPANQQEQDFNVNPTRATHPLPTFSQNNQQQIANMFLNIDESSPVSIGLQTAPWPATYKTVTLPKFNGQTDPQQFIMSYEAAVASTGGDDVVLAKSFIIACEGAALNWYSLLPPHSVCSWLDLKAKLT